MRLGVVNAWRERGVLMGSAALEAGMVNGLGLEADAVAMAVRFAKARGGSVPADPTPTQPTKKGNMPMGSNATRARVSTEDTMQGAVLRTVQDAARAGGWPHHAELATAAARAFQARHGFGMKHPGRGQRTPAAIAAAVPAHLPRRADVLRLCQQHRLDAEAAAFTASVLLAQGCAGGLWFFGLVCEGIQVGGPTPVAKAGERPVGERMSEVAAKYPELKNAMAVGGSPFHVPTRA